MVNVYEVNEYNTEWGEKFKAIKWNRNNLRKVIDLIGLHSSAEKWTWKEYKKIVKKDGLKVFTSRGNYIVPIGEYIALRENDIYTYDTMQFNDIVLREKKYHYYVVCTYKNYGENKGTTQITRNDPLDSYDKIIELSASLKTLFSKETSVDIKSDVIITNFILLKEEYINFE